MVELQNKVIELEEKLTSIEMEKSQLEKEIEEYKTSNENLNERNKRLEEHNQKLFLRATATYKEEPKQQTEEESIKVLKAFADNLNKDEINILNELIEGDEF